MKPHKNSYCVVADKIYAGEYARDLDNPQVKVNQLVDFGITHFIDLTEEGELEPYQQLLPEGVTYRRFPIKDCSVPKNYESVAKLMEYVADVIKKKNAKVYIHCWGGVGRTGLIVGCLYEYFGEKFEEALAHLRKSFQDCPKSKFRHTPETQQQVDFIKGFGEFLKTWKETQITSAKKRYTPANISSLGPNEIFVFGSNLAGHHGGGAARAALNRFGAVWGVGVGLQGRSYAIPTMQGGPETIKPYVDQFIEFAKSRPDLTFLVTRIGCGIAAFKDEEIAPLFAVALNMENIVLPKKFADIIESKFPFAPAEVEAVVNWVLPGLQLFYRDTDIDVDLDQLAEAYRNQNLIRAGFFIDCTSRAAKPMKRIRFIIASAHAAALWEVIDDPKVKEWRLNVLDFNSYFKIVDTYRVGDQLQILLLHIPLRGIPLFGGLANINIENSIDLIGVARKSFDEKMKMAPMPWLETEEWNARTEHLPGFGSNGWADLQPVTSVPPEAEELHNVVLSLSHDDTDLNKPE